MTLDLATFVDGEGAQVDRILCCFSTGHSVITWVAFCSYRIESGLEF